MATLVTSYRYRTIILAVALALTLSTQRVLPNLVRERQLGRAA